MPSSSLPPNWGPLVPRVILGIVFVFHGGQKLFGLFGGDAGSIDKLAELITTWGWPMPKVLAYSVGVTEFFGGACVLIGLLTRFWSVGLAFTMIVAAWKVHGPQGFSLPNGWEFNFVLGTLAAALAVQGGGAFSLDEMFFKAKPKPSPADKPPK